VIVHVHLRLYHGAVGVHNPLWLLLLLLLHNGLHDGPHHVLLLLDMLRLHMLLHRRLLKLCRRLLHHGHCVRLRLHACHRPYIGMSNTSNIRGGHGALTVTWIAVGVRVSARMVQVSIRLALTLVAM
jgi:hypothetical protein